MSKKRIIYEDTLFKRKFPWVDLEKYRPRWFAKKLYNTESRYAQEKFKNKVYGKVKITPEEEKKLHQIHSELVNELTGLPVENRSHSSAANAKKSAAAAAAQLSQKQPSLFQI